MTTALVTITPSADAIELALIGGDLSKLTPEQRVSYYNAVCQSLDLNPLTKPFAYITLNSKLVLYALKDCTEQLRSKRAISVQIVAREVVEDIYVVTARATTPANRCDESIGAVPLGTLKGEARANAIMKAETKAKRRVTLSICGLGMLDETEVDSIPHGGYTVTTPAPVAAGLPAASVATPSVPNGGSTSGQPLDVVVDSERVIPAGAALLTKIDSIPTKNKNVTKYVVTYVTSDGVEHTAGTIKTQLASLCEQLVQERDLVTVETKETKWGMDLESVRRYGVAIPKADPLTDELTAESIPF